MSKKKVFNIVIYCIAAILITVGLYILIKEMTIKGIHDDTENLVSEEDYYNHIYDEITTFTAPVRPVSHYENVPVKLHFYDVVANGKKQNVSCELYAVGFNKDKSMGTVDSAEAAAWLSVAPYAAPGDVGNAVIAGHNLWKGSAGTFSLLKEIQKGTKVAVTFEKGFSRYFEVVDKYESAYNDTAPMKTDVNEPVLTLVTCKGDWSSTLDQSKTRIIVVCKPIKNS